MFDAQDLANRYGAVFNEPDRDTRAKLIAALWAEDGEHHGGFDGKGHAELLEGIEASHANWNRTRRWKWIARTPAKTRQNVVFYLFDAITIDDPQRIMASGAQMLIVNEQGMIQQDYTFVIQAPE